jgi:hypothetical protein
MGLCFVQTPCKLPDFLQLASKKMVVAVGFEPTYFPFQIFRLRVFRCHSLHMVIQRFPNEIKDFLASPCNQVKEFLCKICAIPQAVQKVCKFLNRTGICAKVVQTEGGVFPSVSIPWHRPLALCHVLDAFALRTVHRSAKPGFGAL